ncbi:hypothetical protein J4218_02080 [Candidatus Pacearchaeota archaeon]|nr:hypothetical protein [uncultured archaeon]AQS29142.1 hypothetical protein [uncultured archaeon]MBS3078886.1 hypothetical protein [Candidatus Pacearchaeota archaeon]
MVICTRQNSARNMKIRELEKVLSSDGDEPDEPIEIFSCLIGDTNFQTLLKSLRKRHENHRQVEEANYKRRRKEIETGTYDSEEKRKRDLDLLERFQEIIWKAIGIDYDYTAKEQYVQSKITFPDSRARFLGIELQIANPHLHAYRPITRLLETTKEPLTIVRFDAHLDCHETEEDRAGSGNYMTQILFDNKLSRKISRVINISEQYSIDNKVYKKFRDPKLEKEFRSKAMRINNIPYLILNIKDLPEINDKAIVDIDLDGCETQELGPRGGGHIYRIRPYQEITDIYYNQRNICIHPRIAAGILRSKIKQPVSVLISLERAYRNRLFWYRVEKDFIEELAA